MVTIPRQYWTGRETIKTRTPWLVPAAIHALDRWLRPDDTVLELGGGGSTLFFADRCKRVVTFERSGAYFDELTCIVEDECLKHVELWGVSSEAEVLKTLASTYVSVEFSVIVPDWDEPRDFLYAGVVRHVSDSPLFVLDNYAAPSLFPTYGEHLPATLQGTFMREAYYDDKHWYGKGTKLIYCESRGVLPS